MKKQIDPNLNSTESEDILFNGAYNEPINAEVEKKDVGSDIQSQTAELNKIVEKTTEEKEHRHHHHHHSSSGEHHHSHSSHSSHSSSHHHHRHHSSSKKKKRKKKINKKLKAVLIVLLVIAFLLTAFGGAFSFIKHQGKKDLTAATITDNTHDEIITYKGHRYSYNENVVSFAFMGIDQRDMLSKNDTDFVGCADADVVVAVDTADGTVKVINIPRDTMVDVDVYNDTGVFLSTDNVQLCLAYAYGDGKTKSCENVTKAISRILYNVPINKYFALDLEGVAPINDAIGGVTLEAQYSVPDKGIVKGQIVTLKGDMAEAYIRTRDMDYLEASLNRSARIEQYVKAFAQQLIPAVKSDFGIISDLYNTASKYSRTNITLNNVTYLASTVLEKGVESFETYTITGKMTETKHTKYPDAVVAEFTPDEESVMQIVLDTYYTQID
ncbi:LCP family protein [uncultured Eubacterium sp.]|uniref:LCP family protein n=1 Tax=uncultured Eubacterium sp. TaxID=165185 RepID=UPI002639F39E|nr:LCP family protein [uncultured Eubacterium sp.]